MHDNSPILTVIKSLRKTDRSGEANSFKDESRGKVRSKFNLIIKCRMVTLAAVKTAFDLAAKTPSEMYVRASVLE